MNRQAPLITMWDRPDETAGWRSGCGLLFMVAMAAFILGFIVGANATRSAPATSPQPAPSVSAAAGAAVASVQATTTTSPEPSPSHSPTPRPTPAPTPRPTPKPAQRTLWTGLASYCAPTPTHCQGWGGSAKLAAVPSFRYGDRPYYVTVRTATASVRVKVVSYCGCGNKIIDLSPSAFQKLAPLSRGVVRVRVTR